MQQSPASVASANRWYRRYRGYNGLVHHSYVRDDGEELNKVGRKWEHVYARETCCGITPVNDFSKEGCEVPDDPGLVTCFACIGSPVPGFDPVK